MSCAGLAGGQVGADQRDGVAGGVGFVADQHDLNLLRAEYAVPQAAQGRGVHGCGGAVAVHRGRGERGGRGEVGQRGQLAAFEPRAAAAPGARRGELVEGGVGAQPGGPGDRGGQAAQGAPGVGAVGDHVQVPAGQRGGQLADQPAGQGEPGVLDPLVHQGKAHRQGDRPVQKRQPHHDRRDHPVVAVTDGPLVTRRPVMEPGRGVHPWPAAVKQRVVDRDRHRLIIGDQRRDDQPGQHRRQFIDRPARVREEPVRAVMRPHPRQPGADQHPAHRAPSGLREEPGRQCAEHREARRGETAAELAQQSGQRPGHYSRGAGRRRAYYGKTRAGALLHLRPRRMGRVRVPLRARMCRTGRHAVTVITSVAPVTQARGGQGQPPARSDFKITGLKVRKPRTGGTALESPDEPGGCWTPAMPLPSVTRLTSGERGAAAQHRF